MANRDTINMTFVCDEDIDNMTCVSGGRHCQSCDKVIHDLTHLSTAEIRLLKEKNSDLCGIFTVEQVDPDIIRHIHVPLREKAAIWFSSLFLLLHAGDGYAQSGNDPKIEQSQGNSNAPNLSLEQIERNMNRGNHISLSRAEPLEETEQEQRQKSRKRNFYRRRRVYVSKRFPFIHVRRRFRAGKF